MPISARIAKQQLTFLGHAPRAPPTQEVIKLTLDPDPSLKRPIDRQRGRWEDQVSDTLQGLGVSDWTVYAQCRTTWQELSKLSVATTQLIMQANDLLIMPIIVRSQYVVVLSRYTTYGYHVIVLFPW